jgi:hypothetical protein
MMTTYNLIQVVNFPPGISNDIGTLIDNIFLDFTRLNRYSVYPMNMVTYPIQSGHRYRTAYTLVILVTIVQKREKQGNELKNMYNFLISHCQSIYNG